MIDRSLFNVEDFLVDNTFQLYCAGTDKLCIAYWENYIEQHPEQDHVIKEARRLYKILSGNKKPLDQQIEVLKENIQLSEDQGIIPIRKNYTWLRIAAAVILIAGVSILYRSNQKEHAPKKNLTAYFSTRGAERKKLLCPTDLWCCSTQKAPLQLVRILTNAKEKSTWWGKRSLT